MRTSFVLLCLAASMLVATSARAETLNPKLVDPLQPVRLAQPQLSGEIGRRIDDLIYKNFMVIDLDRDFLDPFRHRPPTEPPKDGRRYVGVGKVIDAGAKFAAYTGDPEVARRTTRLIDELMKTRDPDGYLGHMPVEPDGAQNYRNWILHDQEYALLGLVEHFRYCGDEKSLQYARELADYICETFPKNPHPENVCTAGLPEAMLALYACTGEPRYLRFAADTPHGYIHCETELSTLRDWVKTSLTDPKTSHIYVNTARCYSQTMLHRWEPDESLLKSSRFILGELTRPGGCLFVTGSASDREQFSYTQNGRGPISESCVTAYIIRWFGSLMRMEGDLRYGDRIERAVYNALFAAQDRDGRKLRYFTPFEGPRTYFHLDFFCCPGNYRRIVAELPEMVHYRTDDGGIAVNLFNQSKSLIEIDGGRKVAIEQKTDYPTSGSIRIAIEPAEAMEFPLRLRIPRWCPKATLAITDESPREITPGEKFVEIRRTWRPGDVLTLDMPMPWRLVRGHATQEGKVALLRGPVVYCIGTAQNAQLIEKYPEPGQLVIDPESLGEPIGDASIRPEGLKVVAKAWPSGDDRTGPAPLTVVFTEFVDPTGIATYFHVSDSSRTVEDELVGGK